MNEINQTFYDNYNNPILTVDPLGFTNQFVYDSLLNLTQTVDARGNVSKFGYDSKFRLTGSTNGAGDWVTFTYNTDGTLATKTDLGGTSSYTYDTFGNVKTMANPGGLGTVGFLNSTNGDVLSQTNALGFVRSFQYNNRRQLTNSFTTNMTTHVVYDAIGNVVSATDARGFTTSSSWNVLGHLVSTTLPATTAGTATITNAYDNRDWLIKTVNPLGQTTLYNNDGAQRLLSIIDPLNRTVGFGYDADGRKLTSTNGLLQVTVQQYDARGSMTLTADPAGRTAQYVFDATGNQVTLTNRNGKKWQFQFDAANRLTNTVTPLGRAMSQAYNNRGLLVSSKEPSGQTQAFNYDAMGRVTNRMDSVGTTLYKYDANSNPTNVIEGVRTNGWVYDAYDRVVSYKDADGNQIQYKYDLNGNVTNLIYPGNKIVAYAYDSLNHLTNVTDWSGRKTGLTYDLAGRVTGLTRPNGTVRSIGYDVAGQTTNIVEKTAGGTVIAFYKFGWDNAGRMQQEYGAPLPHAATVPTRNMNFDDDNQLTSIDGNSVTMDLDGNMTSGPLTNDTVVSYGYDARNRLVSAGGLGYSYDPAGNRTAVTNGASVTRYVVNPNVKLSQVLLRVQNGVTNYYIYGAGLLYQITEQGTGTNTLSYHYDYRGSTVALTDGSGNVTDRIEYSAYATTTYRSGTNDTPFLFNGCYGVMTDASGLLYMRARYYNPFICRFPNPDPLGFGGGLNFYAYANGNPVSYLDPFGLCASGENSTSTWIQLGNVLTEGDTWWGHLLYTGQLNPAPDIMEGAVDAAGDYVYGSGGVRGFFAAAGTGGKLGSGTYMPGYVAGGELNWTIEGGFGGQLAVGGGLQMRGQTTVVGFGMTPKISEQIGIAGTYNWNEASGGFTSGQFGAQVYGGQANRLGGYGFQGDLSSGQVELGVTYGNAGLGIIVDPSRVWVNFIDSFHIITGTSRPSP